MIIELKAYDEKTRQTFGCAGMAVDVFEKAFSPMQTTDIPFIGALTGEMATYSEDAERFIKLREDAAKEIAEALTRKLLEVMKKNDTHNGWKLIP